MTGSKGSFTFFDLALHGLVRSAQALVIVAIGLMCVTDNVGFIAMAVLGYGTSEEIVAGHYISPLYPQPLYLAKPAI